MKRTIVVVCVILAACSPNTSSSTNEAAQAGTQSEQFAEAVQGAEPIGAMLKAGKPEACAHPAVKARLWGDMEEPAVNLDAADYNGITQDDIEEARGAVGEPTMTDFQALEADNSVGALACGVHIQVGQSGGPSWITYVLRPSLEDESQFLIAYPSGGPGYLWRMAIVGEATRLAEARKPKEPEPEPEPEENVTGM